MECLVIDDQAIQHYVGGQENGTLLRIRTQQGNRLLVTVNHPLVLSNGVVIPANAVAVGVKLLTVQGTDEVCSVEQEEYNAMVYNILPKSAFPKQNVLITGNLFTGSIRFQNEWATTSGRLRLRDALARESN